LSVERRQLCDELLICGNRKVEVEAADGRDLSVMCRQHLLKRYSEAFVKFKRYNGFWKLIEVSSENVGSIMHTVARPQQSLPVLVWCVEDCDKLFDPALGACKTKYALHIGRCIVVSL